MCRCLLHTCFLFFTNEKFQNTWLLYLGSVLFAFAVLISDVVVSKKLKNVSKLSTMFTTGLKIIFRSIIIVCVIVALLAFIFRNNIFKQRPANFDSLYLLLPLSAILVKCNGCRVLRACWRFFIIQLANECTRKRYYMKLIILL
jgi:hypothetical protein